ncbi:hypothetical protein L209DRAFT_236544 [Thermothelomyces heterothallicus CBS 203.75]
MPRCRHSEATSFRGPTVGPRCRTRKRTRSLPILQLRMSYSVWSSILVGLCAKADMTNTEQEHPAVTAPYRAPHFENLLSTMQNARIWGHRPRLYVRHRTKSQRKRSRIMSGWSRGTP